MPVLERPDQEVLPVLETQSVQEVLPQEMLVQPLVSLAGLAMALRGWCQVPQRLH